MRMSVKQDIITWYDKLDIYCIATEEFLPDPSVTACCLCLSMHRMLEYGIRQAVPGPIEQKEES